MLLAPDILQKRLGSDSYTFERMPMEEVERDIVSFCTEHSLNSHNLIEQYKRSNIRSLTYNEWERMRPPLSFWHASCHFSDRDVMIESASSVIGKDCRKLLTIIHESGNIIHSPIIVRLSSGLNFVASGNTRLMLCSLVGVWPKVVMLNGDV